MRKIEVKYNNYVVDIYIGGEFLKQIDLHQDAACTYIDVCITLGMKERQILDDFIDCELEPITYLLSTDEIIELKRMLRLECGQSIEQWYNASELYHFKIG